MKYQSDGSNYGRDLNDEELARRMHRELNNALTPQEGNISQQLLSMPPFNMNSSLRTSFEHELERCMLDPVFNGRLPGGGKLRMDSFKSAYEMNNANLQLAKCCGELYDIIAEKEISQDTQSRTLLGIWRYREPVTFDQFFRHFQLHLRENEEQFPVTAAVLKYERDLHLIKYAADILAWEHVLFSVFKPGSITREEAGSITNEDVIEMLPVHERESAQLILSRFCTAFNASITQPGNLRGCTRNMFVSEDLKEIDLGCFQNGSTRTVMDFSSPIAFSLPNEVQVGSERVDSITGKRYVTHEYADPRGLCVRFILDRLQV